MNKEGGSTLTIRKSNRVTDGFKGYKATLFAGEMSYTEINIPLRKGDDLFLHGNKDAGCIGYFSGSEVLLFGSYGLFARDDDSRYLLAKERRETHEKETTDSIHGNAFPFGDKQSTMGSLRPQQLCAKYRELGQ